MKILVCAGGGARGLFSYKLLRTIQTQLSISLHDYFDLFVGSSIGALIATHFAQESPFHSSHSAQSAQLFTIEQYRQIFNKGLLEKTLGLFQIHPVYDGVGKRAVIEQVNKVNVMSEFTKPVVITAYEMKGKNSCPLTITSYDPEFQDWSVNDVLDACSAAPCYFPPITYKNRLFIDGGVACNQPLLVAFSEAQKILKKASNGNGGNGGDGNGDGGGGDGNNNYVQSFHDLSILSIGTGIINDITINSDEKKENWGTLSLFEHGLLDLLTEAPNQSIVKEMTTLFKHLDVNHLHLNYEFPTVIQLDDTSPEHHQLMEEYAEAAYRMHEVRIKQFFKKE